jgi:excisionase family DNA binding protein
MSTTTGNESEDSMLSRGQVAALLGLSPERVRQLAAAGVLPSQRTPLGRLYRLSDVEAYAKSRHQQSQDQQSTEHPGGTRHHH